MWVTLGSNQRPLARQASALPTELITHRGFSIVLWWNESQFAFKFLPYPNVTLEFRFFLWSSYRAYS